MIRLAISLLASCAVVSASFDAQHWKWRRKINVQPSPLSSVVLDLSVYGSSLAQLRDLRIIRAGAEVPYILRTESGSAEVREFYPAVLNKAVVPAVGLQAILDLQGHPEHNRVMFRTTEHNFKQTVKVETSDDARQWSLVNKDGIIFDISREDRQIADLAVQYPASTRRYLRVSIEGWTDPNWLTSAEIAFYQSTTPVYDNFESIGPTISEDTGAKTTEAVFDLRVNVPFQRVRLSAGPGLFSRFVEYDSSDDGKTWSPLGAGTVSRDTTGEQLTLEFRELWRRYFRLRISNGDSPPIKLLSGEFSAVRRIVNFRSNDAGPHWLYSGNANAAEPSYDLARVIQPSAVSTRATLAEVGPNPRYRAPAVPWTERRPWLLNAILIAALLVMVPVTVRLLLKLRSV